MMQTLDKNIPHKLKIKLVTLSRKEVTNKNGVHLKYDIEFENGYVGELLQLKVPSAVVPAVNGQIICFVIEFRNNFGDEIKMISQEQYDQMIYRPTPNQMGMSGSSRVIALTAAIQISNCKAEMTGPEENEPERIIERARIFEKYLME